MIPLQRLLRAVAIACTLATSVFAQSYTFTRIAGSPATTGYLDAAGTSARFDFPLAVAVDATGNIYVGEAYNHTVRRISPSGLVTTIAGAASSGGWADGTGAAARIGDVTGIAIDPSGNIWIADSSNHVIRRITTAGAVSTVAGNPGVPGASDGTGFAAHFRLPTGIAIDPDGNAYVSDRGNRTIRKVTSAGVVSTVAGRAGFGGETDGVGTLARFNALAGICIDSSRNLYVADSSSHTIRKIAADSTVTTIAGLAGTSGSTNGTGTSARFSGPRGIAVTADGTLYVTDYGNHRIRKVSSTGTVSTFAGGSAIGNWNGTGTSALFYGPFGIASDSAGNVYVTEVFNNTIRKITAAGAATAVAGSGGAFGSTDGKYGAARFDLPKHITTAPNGSVYIAEAGNATIRRITPSGYVTTVAGSPRVYGTADGIGESARFTYPLGIASDSAGNIYISDFGMDVIRKMTPDGAVTTISGSASEAGGAVDGEARSARYDSPAGLAFDSAGNLYIADRGNHTIRKLSTAGIVTTIAGTAKQTGSTDGSGAAARFNQPSGIAVAADGTLFVADLGNDTIRKIAADGTVSTLAGSAGVSGTSDGTGTAALFDGPYAIAIDASGNLFVADSVNATIRKVTPAGVVTTIGGTADTPGTRDGTGNDARFISPGGIAVDGQGVLYVVDTNSCAISRATRDEAPRVSYGPASLSLRAGATATLSVTATGGGETYQWRRSGVPIAGATSRTLALANVQEANAGDYTVTVTNSAGSVTSSAATVSLTTSTNIGRIGNLSIRAGAGSDADALFVGYAVQGDSQGGTKPLLIRAVGPTLFDAFGLPGVLPDPKLEVFGATGLLMENDNWGGDAQISSIGAQLYAFPFSSSTSKDSAVYATNFGRETFSAKITSKGAPAGIVLAEIYDATTTAFTLATPRLVNVSARTRSGTGADVLAAGFVIHGETAKNVLIRAIGPTLGGFGVAGVLADPKLELFQGSTKINENDDWGGGQELSDAFTSTYAFGLSPTSRDAAMLVTLPPGSYTVQASGLDNTTGIALVEVYEVQ